MPAFPILAPSASAAGASASKPALRDERDQTPSQVDAAMPFMPWRWFPFSSLDRATFSSLELRACDGFGTAALCPQGTIEMRLADQAVDAFINARYAINRSDLPPALVNEVQGTLLTLGNWLADGGPMPAMQGNFLDHLRTLVQEPNTTENFHHALAQLQGANPSAETPPGQINHAQQNVTLHRLQTSGIAEAQQCGKQLATVYHDTEMSLLTQDVYKAVDIKQTANSDRAPPVGWSRLSEQPEKMKEFAERMGLESASELQELLRPNKSGFRAEIYLPDENILGPGYKPTLVFKGSGGKVSTADGQSHGTGLEDFLGNNLPQAIGMKTDYYDRAMTLGALMKESGMAFEVAGHSLGGGLATAAAAVSGARATVVNAASLHPETVRRFAKEHPEVEVHDISQSTTNYQVPGELLNHGVQDNLSQNMTDAERAQLGSTLQDLSQLARDLPAARALLDTLKDGLPEQAQATIDAFIDKLAQADTAQLMRDMPPPVGRVLMLEPYQINALNQLVPRPATVSVQELTHAADPLLPAIANAAKGAKEGMASDQGVQHAMKTYGNTVLMNATADMALADGARASTQDVLGEAQARIQHLKGQLSRAGASVQSGLLNSLASIPDLSPDLARQLRAHAQASVQTGQRAADTAQAQAQQTLGNAHQRSAAIRQESQNRTEETMRWAATPDTTPSSLANFGAAAGVLKGITKSPDSLKDVYAMTSSFITLFTRGGPAIREALDRHSVDKTVVPSMVHYVQQQERRALKALDTPQTAKEYQQRLRLLIQMQENK